MLIWSDILSSCMCAFIAFLLRSAVSAKYNLAPKCLYPYLYFRLACQSNIIRLLLYFRYPMGLLNNGFELKVVEEAEPPKEMMDIPGMEDELRRPMMLLVKAIAKK